MIEITVGMYFSSKWFSGICSVISIDEKNNTLEVHIDRERGYHDETWNLQHTIWGFENGDYKKA
jgi:hypothetical protein